MAEGKNGVIVYKDWITTFEDLTDEEAGRLIKHFFRYVNDQNPEAPDRITRLMFEPFKRQLKSDLKRWEAVCERNRNNGAKGGRPKKEPNPTETEKTQSVILGLNKTQSNPNKPDTDTDTDNDIDRDKEKNNTIGDKPPKVDVYPFEDFWNNYGKKIDSKKCRSKWAKISNKDKILIKDYLPKYVNATPDVQYRKNPLTFLNGETWNDDLPKGALKPPKYNSSYERWDGSKRWFGSIEIPYDAPPRPDNLAKWDKEQNKWIHSNF